MVEVPRTERRNTKEINRHQNQITNKEYPAYLPYWQSLCIYIIMSQSVGPRQQYDVGLYC